MAPPNSRMESIFYNESVELLVYCFEVLAKPCTNKQYPTQALYTLEQYMTMQVMNGSCLPLCYNEFARFRSKES